MMNVANREPFQNCKGEAVDNIVIYSAFNQYRRKYVL